MSIDKKAGELLDAIYDDLVLEGGQAKQFIIAALRQERESAVERMTAAYDGRGSLRNFKAMCAAIIKEG